MGGITRRIAKLHRLRREGTIRSILIPATAAAATRSVRARYACLGYRTCIGNQRLGIGGIEGTARRLKGSRLLAVPVWTAWLILVARFKIALLV